MLLSALAINIALIVNNLGETSLTIQFKAIVKTVFTAYVKQGFKPLLYQSNAGGGIFASALDL